MCIVGKQLIGALLPVYFLNMGFLNAMSCGDVIFHLRYCQSCLLVLSLHVSSFLYCCRFFWHVWGYEEDLLTLLVQQVLEDQEVIGIHSDCYLQKGVFLLYFL